MRRLALVGVLALCACGARDEGLDGLDGSGGPEDNTAKVAGGDSGSDGEDGDDDTTSTGDHDDDAGNGDPADNGDPNDTDWDYSPSDGDTDGGDLDCPPPYIPPPVTCPVLDCPTWEPWCDGDCIVLTGEHFAHPGQASLVVRFTGDYSADGCAPEEVDVRYRATYESPTQATFIFEAGSAPRGFGLGGGSFNGTMTIVNLEPDGTEWTSAPVSVAIEF